MFCFPVTDLLKLTLFLFFSSDSIFQIISVSKETGLGLQIVGGIDKNEGPLVYILAVIPGGDCHKVQKAEKSWGRGFLSLLFSLRPKADGSVIDWSLPMS